LKAFVLELSKNMSEFEFFPERLPDVPDFSDLPWSVPLSEWPKDHPRLEEVQHGISRHPVVFVNYDGKLYAIKEMPGHIAQREYDLLTQIYAFALPCVKPIGFASTKNSVGISSILITSYLEASIPFRYLFLNNVIDQFQAHLLDSIAGLLVQLHLNGFYWGDCSLSNILFRRDAGTLQAYLVDAETAEFHTPQTPPMLRYHDLEIMQENIHGELTDLEVNESVSLNGSLKNSGSYIKQRYRALWEQITREDIIKQDEQYKVQERIRALNELGFSVKDIELKNEDHGNILKLRIFVSDRNFHRNQLMEITGLLAEDRQAQQIINEIYELKAYFTNTGNPNITIEAVAYHWMEHMYKPVIDWLKPYIHDKNHPKLNSDPIELYCQILEHKWYMSERAQQDVGHLAAVEDFIKQFT
jgi:tRNA A-37 threonylcarbamoyl transferase component Bud32